MQVKLHLVRGNPHGKQVEIPPGTTAVGRAEDSDLIIASTRVSRHHCEIINEETRLLVRDKGSGNGTLVNGKKVEEQVLNVGDEIQIGPLTFRVEIEGAGKASAPTSVAPSAPASKAAPAPKSAPPPAKPAPRVRTPPPAAKPKISGKAASPQDILASLERLAEKKKTSSEKAEDDILDVSDEDLIGGDNP